MQTHHGGLRLLFALLALVVAAVAQSGGNDGVEIWNDSDMYQYYGCYNETTEIEGSAKTRALADGTNQIKNGEMTVPMCLALCSDGRTQWRYAGLEYSRECWCSNVLAGISEKLDDKQCDLPCDGDQSMACGGALKLSVYRLASAAGDLRIPNKMWAAAGLLMATALHCV
jgi:hypothetical protein